MRPSRASFRQVVLVLAIASTIGGCRKPVHFPVDGDPAAAERLSTVGAYDANHDGRADFFTYANGDGRIDRIAYDITGDQQPGQIINLDAIPLDNCRHLVIVLDGFGYDLLSKYYADGHLRMFHSPSRVVAPYPTMTDMCMQDILAGMPCRAFEARYFDRNNNRLVGGSSDYLAGKNEPYNKLLHYRATMLWDAIGYIEPWAVFGKEINDAKRLFDRAETKEVLAYFVSSAGVGTAMGAQGQRMCLVKIEQMVNQIIAETRGLTKITLTSDHGHSYTKAKRINIEEHLRSKGWRLSDSLREPGDVVYISYGLVTCANFATSRPAALAKDLASCEGVELASYPDKDTVTVLSADGGKATIYRRADRYRYQPSSGDPLKLAEILAELSDQDGFYEANDLLAATISHEYPAPLQRLWRAHFSLVQNPPDVIVSLADNFFSGSKSFAGSVTVASTHGGLNYANSVTFIMSTAGTLPRYMRSREISKNMAILTGKPWPTMR